MAGGACNNVGYCSIKLVKWRENREALSILLSISALSCIFFVGVCILVGSIYNDVLYFTKCYAFC